MLGSTKSLDKSIQKACDAILSACHCWSQSLQIVSVGAAICLVLLGCSSVIRAIKEKEVGEGEDGSSKKKRDKQTLKDNSKPSSQDDDIE